MSGPRPPRAADVPTDEDDDIDGRLTKRMATAESIDRAVRRKRQARQKIKEQRAKEKEIEARIATREAEVGEDAADCDEEPRRLRRQLRDLRRNGRERRRGRPQIPFCETIFEMGSCRAGPGAAWRAWGFRPGGRVGRCGVPGGRDPRG